MAVNINVKLNADDSSVKKKLSELGKLAKKGLNFGGGKDGTPSSSGKPNEFSKFEKAMNRLSKAIEKETKAIEKQGKAKYAWEKAKFVGGKVGRFAGAAAEGFHTGASLSRRATSGHSEFTSGGFMNAAQDKISAVQDTYSKAKEGYGSIKDAYKGQKEIKDEHGNVTQAGRKGGIAAAAVAGIPVVGGVIGAVVGGILNQINDMGKEYVSTMRTQQGTIGATGGYVGGYDKNTKLGNPYFANAQMAQAQVSFNRTQGAFGNKSILKDSNTAAFAAQQNIGIAQYTEQLGQLKENDESVSTNFLRGAADINKMTGLKQGQFVAKLAQYSTSMKEAGYNTEGVKQFASLTGGLAQAGMKGERAFTVGQTLNEDVRKGVGGGVMSKLALAKLMSSGKGDYFEMSQLMEEEGLGNKDVREAYGESLDMFDPKIRGQIMKGQATRKESGLLTGNALQSKITEDTSGVKAGGSSALAIENARMSMITQKGGIGEKSAKLSHTMAADSLALFEQLNKNKTLDKVVDALGVMEKGVFTGIDASLKKMTEYFDAFEKGDLMKKMGQDLKEGFGSIF